MFDRSLLHALFGSEMSRARNELQRTPTFMDLYHEMEAMFVKPSAGTRALIHNISVTFCAFLKKFDEVF